MRRSIKLLLLIFIAVQAIYLTLRYRLFSNNQPRTEGEKKAIMRFYRRLCSTMGLSITVEGEPPKDTALVVANHISWLDIPVTGCMVSTTFLAKSEIRKWPFIGWLASKHRTIFIRRGTTGAAQDANLQIASRLNQNESVLLFPEGTTTTGETVRKFHPRLFGAANDTATKVAPVAIQYLDTLGKPHKGVPFVNNTSFAQNVWIVMGEKRVDVQLKFLPEVFVTSDTGRKELARTSEEHVRSALQ